MDGLCRLAGSIHTVKEKCTRIAHCSHSEFTCRISYIFSSPRSSRALLRTSDKIFTAFTLAILHDIHHDNNELDDDDHYVGDGEGIESKGSCERMGATTGVQ